MGGGGRRVGTLSRRREGLTLSGIPRAWPEFTLAIRCRWGWGVGAGRRKSPCPEALRLGGRALRAAGGGSRASEEDSSASCVVSGASVPPFSRALPEEVAGCPRAGAVLAQA